MTLSVVSENSPGVLQRITVLFTRRRLNIESLTVSESEKPAVSRFTIVIHAEREIAEKVAKQIHRIIEVSDVYVCEDDELVFKEIALYKLRYADKKTRDEIAERVQHHHGIMEEPMPGRLIIEMMGSEVEIQTLYKDLEPFGILQFIRSGRIALLKNERTSVEEPQSGRELDLEEESSSMM